MGEERARKYIVMGQLIVSMDNHKKEKINLSEKPTLSNNQENWDKPDPSGDFDIQDFMDALNLDSDVITETVELIQASGCDTIASVHSEKKDVVIGPGQRCLVKCKVPVGILEESTAVVFEPDEIQQWPEELEVCHKLITLKKGLTKRLIMPIVNKSGHDVQLRGNTCLGRLELVQSVIPMEVRRVES